MYGLRLAPSQVCVFIKMAAIAFCRGESILVPSGLALVIGLRMVGFRADFFSAMAGSAIWPHPS